MSSKLDKLIAPLDRLDGALFKLAIPNASQIQRWRTDAAALRFHLRVSPTAPAITVIIGGTGTGKSTLVNRLIGADVTATSFRRTFTAGPVAVARSLTDIPDGWLGVPHTIADPNSLPARGQTDCLIVVETNSPSALPVVDTPDLDGDQPAHHAQADRAFRWAQRLIFVVTPEKYQMTELLPYYRLASRYEIPALFVMNKCEEQSVVDDFRKQLSEREWPEAKIFVVARNDAGFEPAADSNLKGLGETLTKFDFPGTRRGCFNRAGDLAARLADQIINPLRNLRQTADGLTVNLRAMEANTAGIDVNPITQQLQRRLQQRSVLYLIGPQRVLDRVRQMPTLAARLPRAAWDWVMRGQVPNDLINPKSAAESTEPPDFAAVLADQFTILRSRIDDCLRTDPVAAKWITDDKEGYENSLVQPTFAGKIAEEEIEALRQWLQTRWNATPRDTRVLQSLLKYLPGSKRLTRWSEAAPYLLTLALVAHGAFFGHLDLMVLGGYSIATWLTERISNEVAGRTRATNRKISDRFERLAHEQIQSVCQWLSRQVPSTHELEHLQRLLQDFTDIIETNP